MFLSTLQTACSMPFVSVPASWSERRTEKRKMTAASKVEYQTVDVVVLLASGPNPAKLCSMVST